MSGFQNTTLHRGPVAGCQNTLDSSISTDNHRQHFLQEQRNSDKKLTSDLHIKTNEPAKHVADTYSKVYTFQVPAGTDVSFSYTRFENGDKITGHPYKMAPNAISSYDKDNAYIKKETINGVDHYTVGTYKHFNGTYNVISGGKVHNLNPATDIPVQQAVPKTKAAEPDTKEPDTKNKPADEIKSKTPAEAEKKPEIKAATPEPEKSNPPEVKPEVKPQIRQETPAAAKPSEVKPAPVVPEKPEEPEDPSQAERQFAQRQAELELKKKDLTAAQQKFREEKIASMQSRLGGAEANLRASKAEVDNAGFWTNIVGGRSGLEMAVKADQTLVDEYRSKEKVLLGTEKDVQTKLKEAAFYEKEAAKCAAAGLHERSLQMLAKADEKLRIADAWLKIDTKANTGLAQGYYKLAGERMKETEENLAKTETTLRTVRNGTVIVGATLATGGVAAAGFGATAAVAGGTAVGTGIGALSNATEAAGHVAVGNKNAGEALADAASQTVSDAGTSLVSSVSMVAGGQAAGAASKFIPSQAAGIAARTGTGAAAGAATLGTSAVISETQARIDAKAEFDEMYQYVNIRSEDRAALYDQFLEERGLKVNQIAGTVIQQATTGAVVGAIGGVASAQTATGMAPANAHLAGMGASAGVSTASHVVTNGSLSVEDLPGILTDATVGYVAGNVAARNGTGTARVRRPAPDPDATTTTRQRYRARPQNNTATEEAPDFTARPNTNRNTNSSSTNTNNNTNRNPNYNYRQNRADTDPDSNPNQNTNRSRNTRKPEEPRTEKPEAETVKPAETPGPEIPKKKHPIFNHADELRSKKDAMRALGFEPNETPSFTEIRSRANKLSMEYHPDRNRNVDLDPQAFQIIQRAFELLGK